MIELLVGYDIFEAELVICWKLKMVGPLLPVGPVGPLRPVEPVWPVFPVDPDGPV